MKALAAVGYYLAMVGAGALGTLYYLTLKCQAWGHCGSSKEYLAGLGAGLLGLLIVARWFYRCREAKLPWSDFILGHFLLVFGTSGLLLEAVAVYLEVVRLGGSVSQKSLLPLVGGVLCLSMGANALSSDSRVRQFVAGHRGELHIALLLMFAIIFFTSIGAVGFNTLFQFGGWTLLLTWALSETARCREYRDCLRTRELADEVVKFWEEKR